MAEATRLIDTDTEEIVGTDVIEEDVIELDLSDLRKKRIKITGLGGEEDILEINTSDLGVVTRLHEVEPKLAELENTALQISNLAGQVADDDNAFAEFSEKLSSIDTEMRSMLDTVFQANVSETCGKEGSMFDPIKGTTRWQIIIQSLIQLYDESVKREMETKPNYNVKRVHFHTDKYTGKR